MHNLDALRRALSQGPDSLPLLILFAQASLEQLNLDDARKAFERVLHLDASNKEAQLGLARVLYLEGKTSEAAVRVERLLKEDADYAPAHLLLSRLHLVEDNRPEAIDHFHKAIALDSTISDPALEHDLGKNTRPQPKRQPSPSYLESSQSMDSEELSDAMFGADWMGGLEEASDLRGDGFFFPPPPIERPAIQLQDVGGMEAVKAHIRMQFTYPLVQPDLFKAYGKQAGGSMLLYGPPGCGKSLIARAAAGEAGAAFIGAFMHEIFDAYMGNSEKNLHMLFEMARQNAPCVLFFDEVESLAHDRRNVKESQVRSLINQFLIELDEHAADPSGVFVMAATNAPWQLDAAFRRPGRFDRFVFVPPPDWEGRKVILEIFASSKPTSNLDLDAILRITEGWSGADLKLLLDRASDLALSEALQEGNLVPITSRSLIKAASGMIPSTLDWFHTAQNYLTFSNQTGHWNEVAAYLEQLRKEQSR